MDIQEEEEERTNAELKALLESKNKQIDDLKSDIQALYNKVFSSSYFDSEKQDRSENQETRLQSCHCSCHEKLDREFSDVETQTFESDFVNQDSTQSALDWATEGEIKVSDLVREVVEGQPSCQNDYVYDENFRMYYSASTGYYYDTERNLLYEPYSQTYYKYDSKKNAYEVYNPDTSANSADISDKVNDLKLDDKAGSTRANKQKQNFFRKPKSKSEASSKSKSNADNSKSINSNGRKKRPRKKKAYFYFASDESEVEEGEIVSDCSGSSSSDEINYFLESLKTLEREREIEANREKFPPCIRAIIKESSDLKIGDLMIITCVGGIIGRQEINPIYVPDASVSKEHARISFNNAAWQYRIIDLNSENGTFVNDVQVLGDGNKKPHPLKHGDILTLGSCKLLLHIHKGSNTCNECEPGIVKASKSGVQDNNNPAKMRGDKEQVRRQNLRRMKKKFGLQDMGYLFFEPYPTEAYQDRSEIRRKEKGSQNPYEKNEHPTSLDTPLPKTNVGYQMLKNMGWDEGRSLGLQQLGVASPVRPLSMYTGSRSGLGSNPVLDKVPENIQKMRWKKAQKRYWEVLE